MTAQEVQQSLIDVAGKTAEAATYFAERANEGQATREALRNLATTAQILVDTAKTLGESRTLQD